MSYRIRYMLIQQLWSFDYEGDEGNVDTHIKRLRERFADYEQDFRIVTLRGLDTQTKRS